MFEHPAHHVLCFTFTVQIRSQHNLKASCNPPRNPFVRCAPSTEVSSDKDQAQRAVEVTKGRKNESLFVTAKHLLQQQGK